MYAMIGQWNLDSLLSTTCLLHASWVLACSTLNWLMTRTTVCLQAKRQTKRVVSQAVAGNGVQQQQRQRQIAAGGSVPGVARWRSSMRRREKTHGRRAVNDDCCMCSACFTLYGMYQVCVDSSRVVLHSMDNVMFASICVVWRQHNCIIQKTQYVCTESIQYTTRVGRVQWDEYSFRLKTRYICRYIFVSHRTCLSL